MEAGSRLMCGIHAKTRLEVGLADEANRRRGLTVAARGDVASSRAAFELACGLESRYARGVMSGGAKGVPSL